MVAAPMKKHGISSTSILQRDRLLPISYKTKCLILCLTGLLFYANSILNKYAVDDKMVFVDNAYVQMGLAGIPKILTNDSYASYYVSIGGDPAQQLSGGRYRPLSEVVFAIEEEFFGHSEMIPYLLHFVNIIAYVVCLLAIFQFLEKFLFKKIPGGSDMAFLSTFLFAIHPLHTEVVANIKSLDEILSMLFIMLTFIYSVKYLQSKRTKHLLLGMGAYFLALLSKEYAVTLVFFIPLLFYLLEGRKPVQAIKASAPYYGIFFIYLLVRYHAVGFHNLPPGSNLLTNPYYFATHLQKIATEWFVLGKYLGLLFFPYPLCSDYSYYHIKYHNFTDITVLLSILIYIALIVWGSILLRKKSILSFAVFFFLVNIFMISNFAFDIGATMGERLVFHSSLGLTIILSYYILKWTSRKDFKIPVQTKKKWIIVAMSLTGLVCLGETAVRNAQWKDNVSLYIHDAGIAPDGVLSNGNAGWAYLRLAEKKENNIQAKPYLDSAQKYLLRALHLNPKGEYTYHLLGIMYIDKGLLDSAEYCYDMVEKLHPAFPGLESNYALLSKRYFKEGLEMCKNGNPGLAIPYMKKALKHDSADANIWYNMGVAYHYTQQYDSERYAFLKTLQCKPDSFDLVRAQEYLQRLSQMKQQ